MKDKHKTCVTITNFILVPQTNVGTLEDLSDQEDEMDTKTTRGPRTQ